MGASAVMLAILAAACLAAEGGAATLPTRGPAAPQRLCPHQRLKYNCRDCGGGGICEHKRRRSRCKDCGGSGICEHKRVRSQCRDCGGSGICEHKRERSQCRDCGGSSICEHKRVRSQCRDCGGSGICEHKRRRSQCRDCGGGSICEHKRVRSKCRDCGGSGLCEHKRERSLCKACGGSGICEHKRERSKCKDCGGSGICEHKRVRSSCKACGGGSICEHKRVRSTCRDCGGGSICEHKRERSQCKACGGGSICKHKRVRSTCKACGGGGICEHKRVRSSCKACGGGGICEHKRERSKCKACGGGSICEHKRRRSTCKDCGGGSICEHKRERRRCRDCGGGGICEHDRVRSTCRECAKHPCRVCWTTPAVGKARELCTQCHRDAQAADSQPAAAAVGRYLRREGIPLTRRIANLRRPLDATGDEAAAHVPTGSRRKKEMQVKASLDQAGVKFVHDKTVLERDAACPGAKRRPDFQVAHDAQKLVDIWIEVDERQHEERVCELQRLNEMLITRGWQMRPLVVLRLNVDAFKTGFKLSSEPFPRQERHDILLHELKRQTDAARSLAGIPPSGGVSERSATPHAEGPRGGSSPARDAGDQKPQARLSDQAEDVLLTVVRICYDCECTDKTLCGFVHRMSYKDQESIARDMEVEGTWRGHS